MPAPIACSLTADGARERRAEWRRFLAGSAAALERISEQCIRIRLDPSDKVEERAADLAQREKACCAFFDFAIDIEADALWLSVRVPPDASRTLDEFVTLLTRHSRCS